MAWTGIAQQAWLGQERIGMASKSSIPQRRSASPRSQPPGAPLVRGGCGRTSREIRDTACMLWVVLAAVVVALVWAERVLCS